MPTKTLHGCTCLKDWVKMDGKTFSGCVYGSASNPACPFTTDKGKLNNKCPSMASISSCAVEKGCGEKQAHFFGGGHTWRERAKKGGLEKDVGRWDICEPAKVGGLGRPNTPALYYNMARSANIKAIIGLILFLGFAGFIIPYLMYLMGFRTLLNVWVPNIDLIATVFAFRGGLFDTTLFRFLYSESPSTAFGFWSKTIIQYFALLGLTLITAQMVWKRKSISRGMSYALIMLIFSYLIPGKLLATLMDKIYEYLDNASWRPAQPLQPPFKEFDTNQDGRVDSKEFANMYNKLKKIRYWNTQISIICGLIVALGLLLAERFLINNHLHRIDNISSFLVNKLWFFLGHKRIKRRKK